MKINKGRKPPKAEEPKERGIHSKKKEICDNMKATKMTRHINERYFVFRIWNFSLMSYKEFTHTVNEAEKSGFNAVKVHIPWAYVQPDANTMNFAELDKMVDYVVNEKGLKVAISIDLTRRADDDLIGQEHIQRDIKGNLCVGGSHAGDRTVISFCSKFAVEKAVDFYRIAVEHYEKLCGEHVLFYLPAFNPYCETEYWAVGDYDYSAYALAAFSDFLKDKYGSIDKLNAILRTSYTDFGDVTPPVCKKVNGLGRLWYRFRHERLKAVIDDLAKAQKDIAPNSEYAIQLGSVFDNHIAVRGTIAFADLCEHVDVLWVDDGPTYNHSWSMDYISSALGSKVKLAQEIDGPHQNGATPERYLDQGLTVFGHGATYVSAANWSIDENYRKYEHVWREISDTWLGENPPEMKDMTEDTSVLEISLSDTFTRGSLARYQKKHRELSNNGEKFVCIRIMDDLSNAEVDTYLPIYSYPGDFSDNQGENSWYYRSYQNGRFSDMTFDNGIWQREAQHTLIKNDSVQPDEYDAAIIFKSVKDGTVKLSYNLALYYPESEGIGYAVLVNGKPITEIGKDPIELSYDEGADNSMILSLKEGEEIAVVVNSNKKDTLNALAAGVTVEYLN